MMIKFCWVSDVPENTRGPISKKVLHLAQYQADPLDQIRAFGLRSLGGNGGRVVTLLPSTSEAGVWFLSRPQVGKLVVACCWSAIYSTEP